MRTGEICTRNAVICTATTSIVEAARLMRQYHVGDLIVVDEVGGNRIPIGIVTDRDIVVEVVANGVPLDRVAMGDIMTGEVATADETRDAFETLEIMRDKGVRRMPVTDRNGALVGIVTLDDLLELFSEQLATMAKLISHEQTVEARTRPGEIAGSLSRQH